MRCYDEQFETSVCIVLWIAKCSRAEAEIALRKLVVQMEGHPRSRPASQTDEHLSSLTSRDTTVKEADFLGKDEMHKEGGRGPVCSP